MDTFHRSRASQNVGLYADPALGLYGYEEKDWFRPKVRLEAFLAEMRAKGLDRHVSWETAGAANYDDIVLFHTPEYVEQVRTLCARGEGALDHGPTLARPHMEQAAAHVVGAVMDAARRIVSGELLRAFVPIAGFHHAHSEAARMYCLYNDAAIVLSWLLQHTVGPVAYIDIDIHQGDGVYEGFCDQPRVAIVDFHEDASTLFPYSPSSPGTGRFPGRRSDDGVGLAAGTKLNVALRPYTTDAEFMAAWAEAEVFLHKVKPRFVILVSGVDGLDGDPLSHQSMTPAVVADVTGRVREVADRYAEGRLLVLGGGGYELRNVALGWTAVLGALI